LVIRGDTDGVGGWRVGVRGQEFPEDGVALLGRQGTGEGVGLAEAGGAFVGCGEEGDDAIEGAVEDLFPFLEGADETGAGGALPAAEVVFGEVEPVGASGEFFGDGAAEGEAACVDGLVVRHAAFRGDGIMVACGGGAHHWARLWED
jgi:hypothetical protein